MFNSTGPDRDNYDSDEFYYDEENDILYSKDREYGQDYDGDGDPRYDE